MALQIKETHKLRCEIFNELDTDGIDEYRFRFIDADETIILSSSTRYYSVADARAEMNQVITVVKTNPESFVLKVSKAEKHYFNVVDESREIIARRIHYYTTRGEAEEEIERIKKLFNDHDIAVIQIGIPTPKGPCDKDLKICDLHADIQAIYDSCLRDPKPDLERAVACSRDILNIIKIFHSGNPSYKLYDFLEEEINTINRFVGEPTVENYNAATAAVSSILSYLYELGNCDCGGGGSNHANATKKYVICMMVF